MIPGIYGWLTGDSAVHALVGDKVYPNVIPRGIDGPAIVYSMITGGADNYLAENPGIDNGDFQISCWSVAPTVARDAAVAARSALQQRGMVTPGSYSMDYDPDSNMHCVRFSISIWTSR